MTDKLSFPPMPWLRAFEAAARTQSFTAAGDELGLTQAAVSQHIKLLEAQLRVTLFRRLPRGVALTAEGGAYLPHVQAAFRSLARSTDALFGTPGTRPLSIMAPVSFLTLWLAPRLATFRRSFGGVPLTMSTMHLPSDYACEPHDFDIRFGLGTFAGRTSYRLTSERLVPAAAPWLADTGDWPDLPLLDVTGAREMWPDWFAAAARPVPARPLLRFDTYVAAQQAAISGAGVLLASRPLADPALAAGSLKRLSDIEIASDAGHFLTVPAGGQVSGLAQQVLAWFLDQAAGADASQSAGGYFPAAPIALSEPQ
jgi:LysR family glycine cleavage system transcriptional activator/LysR family transcriptional regulator of beta-lactamase